MRIEFWQTVQHWLRRAAIRYVESDAARYRARKVVGSIGYFSAIVFVALVFSDKLGGFTVAFGVAGAGVAFALQEVIASVEKLAPLEVRISAESELPRQSADS